MDRVTSAPQQATTTELGHNQAHGKSCFIEDLAPLFDFCGLGHAQNIRRAALSLLALAVGRPFCNVGMLLLPWRVAILLRRRGISGESLYCFGEEKAFSSRAGSSLVSALARNLAAERTSAGLCKMTPGHMTSQYSEKCLARVSFENSRPLFRRFLAKAHKIVSL